MCYRLELNTIQINKGTHIKHACKLQFDGKLFVSIVFLLWAWIFFVVGKFDFNVHNENGLEISIVTIIPLSNYVN